MRSLQRTAVAHCVLSSMLFWTASCGSSSPGTDASVADTGARTSDGSAQTSDGGPGLGACAGVTFGPETSDSTPRVSILRPLAGDHVRAECTDGPTPVPTCIQVLGDPGMTVQWVEVQLSGQIGYFWLQTQSSDGHRFVQGNLSGGWLIGTESQVEGLRATGNAEFFTGPALTDTSEVVFTLETTAGMPMCPVPM